jgi:hypothetical protein
MNRYWLLLALTASAPSVTSGYPLDGYFLTGIRRLEADRLAVEGEIPGRRQPTGALLPAAEVDSRLKAMPNLEIPAPDAALTAQVEALLGEDIESYGIAVLDVSDPDNPRYAEVRGDYRQNVGSVGKLVVGLSLFQALADTWPVVSDRVRVLRETLVTADQFSHTDTHSVPFFDLATRELTRRPISDGDQASLWEYLDWMLSPSSNSAAGMVMREAMLMRQYGTAYPPRPDEAQRFFSETPRSQLTQLFSRTFEEPLERHGFDLDQFRQGSFFTRGGKNTVRGTGTSYATARSLMRLALLVEKGQLVDEFSSRELKRLIYMTERRIRYASSPSLRTAAVYFKSGSLYGCKPEEGFSCGKYKGNRMNYMNSFAIVESPAEARKLHYMVMIVSNVLRKNSAVDHQTLGTRIQHLMEEAHASPSD